MTSGVNARDIARDMKADKTVIADAFMSGMLHDTGKMILACNFAEKYDKTILLSEEKDIQLYEAELETFGTTHSDVGAYLMGLWGLPDPIVEAIAFHHLPKESECKTAGPLSFVHMGNVFSNNEEPETELKGLDSEYIESMGFEEKVEKWREMCNEMALA